MLEAHSDYKPVEIDSRAGSIGWHGNALLVKKQVEVREHQLLPPALAGAARRGARRHSASTAQVLRVVGMHLDLSGLWRRQQAQAILSHLARRATASRRRC